MTIRVLVADDQAVVRRGLAGIVTDAPGFAVVGEAPDGETAVTRVAEELPDVVLMDVRMPGIGGIEAGRAIVADHAGVIKVLMVTTFDTDAYVFESLRAGASGFILKDAEPDELLDAIRVVHAGDGLLAPSATRRLIAEFARNGPVPGAPAPPARPSAPPLSEREREVVVAVARGLSNAEIAAELFLAPTTVKTHISSALTKWDARDRVQLVIRAFETGLAGPEG